MALDNKLGKIVSVSRVQSPGFSYSFDIADELERYGFKPTDEVYELEIAFGKECSKSFWVTTPNLFPLAQYYGVNRPRKLKGKEVSCKISGDSIQRGVITELSAVPQDNLNQKVLADSKEGIIATYESQPPMAPSHTFYRVNYPSR